MKMPRRPLALATLWLALLSVPAFAQMSEPAAPAVPVAPAAPAAPDASQPPAAVPVDPAAPPAAPPPPKFGIPAKPASVQSLDYIGHRYNEPDDTGGWGWVKLPNEAWSRGRWVTLRETPGLAVAPWRTAGSRDADQNWEYKIHGFFAPYQVYDPHTDEMLDVLVVESIEPIPGATPATPLSLNPGPRDRKSHAIRSTFRSRDF